MFKGRGEGVKYCLGVQDSEQKVEIECDYFGRTKSPLEFCYHDIKIRPQPFSTARINSVGRGRASK